MEQIFNTLLQASRATAQVAELTGRSYGLQWAMVSEVSDPESLGRIKVTTATKGAKYQSDLMVRCLPWFGLSVPLPTVGDIVLIGFIDGDPHQGTVLGYAQNKLNPKDPEDKDLVSTIDKTVIRQSPGVITMTCGDTSNQTVVKMTPDNIQLTSGTTSLIVTDTGVTITNGTVTWGMSGSTMAFNGVTDVTINGQSVATIGAKDTRNDTLVTKGY